jgi:hypothetical protein
MGSVIAWRWLGFTGDTAAPYRRDSDRTTTWVLLDGRGKVRAQIWQNTAARFTWHTYDQRGVGGENAECTRLLDAMDRVVAAIVRQGWTPGGWRIEHGE